jgi:hypothetical protein
VRVPLREAARLIACIRLGAKGIHALDFEVAEDAMMTVAPVRIGKESEEQEYIAHRHTIAVQMSLSGASLTQSAVPVLEHGIMMAEARSRQPTFCYTLDDIAEPEIAVCRDRTSLRGDRQAHRRAVDDW